MRLIANSVFLLSDGSRAVPGAEISADSELCGEWISKGFAYFIADDEKEAVIGEAEVPILSGPKGKPDLKSTAAGKTSKKQVKK